MARSSTDSSILTRVAGGDSAAVGECLDTYGPLVWSLARRMSFDATQAEDSVQEIFIEIWKSAGRYDPTISSEATFIATIARRRLIDRRRSLGRRPETEAIEPEELSGNDENLEHVEISEEASRAREALQTLKPQQRQVIELSVIEGMSHSQIASTTGLPLGTVKSHVRRGLDRVSKLLGRGQEVDGPAGSLPSTPESTKGGRPR